MNPVLLRNLSNAIVEESQVCGLVHHTNNPHLPASFCSSFSIVLFLLWNCSIIPRSLSTNIRSILACMSAIMASMSSSEAGKFLNIYKDRFEIKNQMEIIVKTPNLLMWDCTDTSKMSIIGSNFFLWFGILGFAETLRVY